MTVERGVRLMAGVMVLLSLALAYFLSLYWLWADSLRGTQLTAVGRHELVPCNLNAARDWPQRRNLRSKVMPNDRERFNASQAWQLDAPGARCFAR